MHHFLLLIRFVLTHLTRSWGVDRGRVIIALLKYAILAASIMYLEFSLADASRQGFSPLVYDAGWILVFFAAIASGNAIQSFFTAFRAQIYNGFSGEKLVLFGLVFALYVLMLLPLLVLFVISGASDGVRAIVFMPGMLVFVYYLLADHSVRLPRLPRVMRGRFQQLMYHLSFRFDQKSNFLAFVIASGVFILGVYMLMLEHVAAAVLIGLSYIIFTGNIFGEEIYSHYVYRFSRWTARDFIFSSISLFLIVAVSGFVLPLVRLENAPLVVLLGVGCLVFAIIHTYAKLSAETGSVRSIFTQIVLPVVVGGAFALNPVVGLIVLIFSLYLLFSLISKRWGDQT